jgi:ribosomal subunit interface protein
MIIPLNIIFRNIPSSDAFEAEIRKRAEKLDQFSDRIMRCEVTVELDGKHKNQGKLYEVRIDLTMPGTEIAISHIHKNEDVFVVIRDAFEAAIRQLKERIRAIRGHVKVHEVPSRGRVTKLFEDGYGFIETADGREFYFHRENLVHPDFDRIEIGAEAQFLEDIAGEGLQAKRVSVGKHQSPELPELPE